MAFKKFTEEEVRQRKNERQREYAKKTHYAASIKSHQINTKRYVLRLTLSTDADIIEKLDAEKQKNGYAPYIKALIRQDLMK